LPLSIHNNLIESIAPPEVQKTWIDEQIDSFSTNQELWQWESLMIYHFKITLEDIKRMDDNLFFDYVSRLKWVIEQEQKKWQTNTGN